MNQVAESSNGGGFGDNYMFLAGLKEVEDDLDTLNGGGSIKGASGNFIG